MIYANVSLVLLFSLSLCFYSLITLLAAIKKKG